MRICSGPGCLRVVPDNVRFCNECKPGGPSSEGIKEHVVNPTDRDHYQFLYESNRFQDYCRPRVLARDLVCKRCGCAPSEIVDHVVPAGEAIRQVRESGRFPFDPHAGFFLLSNLQGLCRPCHGKKTVADKTHVGPWPDVLAAYDAMPKKKWSF